MKESFAVLKRTLFSSKYSEALCHLVRYKVSLDDIILKNKIFVFLPLIYSDSLPNTCIYTHQQFSQMDLHYI